MALNSLHKVESPDHHAQCAVISLYMGIIGTELITEF